MGLSEKILRKPKEEKAEKPLCLKIEDAKAEMIEVVNRHISDGVPAFLLEPILKDIYFQIVDRKNAELEVARRAWTENGAEV